jgi:hypothetical protein
VAAFVPAQADFQPVLLTKIALGIGSRLSSVIVRFGKDLLRQRRSIIMIFTIGILDPAASAVLPDKKSDAPVIPGKMPRRARNRVLLGIMRDT